MESYTLQEDQQVVLAVPVRSSYYLITMTTEHTYKQYLEDLQELERLKTAIAKYETPFRGVTVKVGDYWFSNKTQAVYEHDECGVVVGISYSESGRKRLHMYEGGEGFFMYEDGRCSLED